MTGGDSPDLARAKQILDELKARGFEFARTAPGPDGPLLGQRTSESFVDVVYLEGFSAGCLAWRQRRSPLIVPGEELVERQVSGSAVAVLMEALKWGNKS